MALIKRPDLEQLRAPFGLAREDGRRCLANSSNEKQVSQMELWRLVDLEISRFAELETWRRRPRFE